VSLGEENEQKNEVNNARNTHSELTSNSFTSPTTTFWLHLEHKWHYALIRNTRNNGYRLKCSFTPHSYKIYFKSSQLTSFLSFRCCFHETCSLQWHY